MASADDLKSHIASFDRQMTSAMMKKDFTQVKKLIKGEIAPNFVYEENGRRQSLEQMLAGIKMGIGQMNLRYANSKVLTLMNKGTSQVATVHHQIGGTAVGEDKKMHKMTFDGVSENTYVKIGKTWKMSKMRWIKQSTMIDGKEIPTQGGR